MGSSYSSKETERKQKAATTVEAATLLSISKEGREVQAKAWLKTLQTGIALPSSGFAISTYCNGAKGKETEGKGKVGQESNHAKRTEELPNSDKIPPC